MSELRRKVAVVTVAELDDDGKPKSRLEGDELVSQTTKRVVMIDNAALARVEEHFGSVDDWQSELAKRPHSALPKTFALVWDCETAEVEALMIPGTFEEWASMLQRAILFYYGKTEAEVLKVEAAAKAARDNLDEVLAGILNESTGTSGESIGQSQPRERDPQPSSGS